MLSVVFFAVSLRDEAALPLLVAPPPVPAMIGPARTEREVGTPRLEHLVEGSLQEAPALEPVMIVAKPVYPVLLCQIRLGLAHLGQPQIVESQVGRNTWLVVRREARLGLDDVRPLGVACAPEHIVLWDRVKLR